MVKVNTKVNLFWNDDDLLLQKQVNDFIRNKKIIDIKFNTNDELSEFMVMVVYEEEIITE